MKKNTYKISLFYGNIIPFGYSFVSLHLSDSELIIESKTLSVEYIIPIKSIYHIKLMRSPVYFWLITSIRIYHTNKDLPPYIELLPFIKTKILYNELLRYNIPIFDNNVKHFEKIVLIMSIFPFLIISFIVIIPIVLKSC